MEFEDKLVLLAKKVEQQAESIVTEEATKTAIIMPFISSVLGYDVFNPTEVIPEYVADVGTKKGEKVDYAIVNNGSVQILIEAKKIGEDLSIKCASQLYRYFSVTTAKIAILTNGQIYRFYTDLDAPNKMDERPFLELDILDIDDHVIPELKKLAKSNFDVESIINAAGELKYVSQIKKILSGQLNLPDEDFIKFFASKIYDGPITQRVREQFTPLIIKGLNQFVSDKVNERLKTAMSGNTSVRPLQDEKEDKAAACECDDGIITTVEEIEGYNIVKAIVRKVVDAKRVIGRDTKSYFGILLDDNNRKPICRLHFNRSQKYLGVFDQDKNETRNPIETLDDIFKFEEQLKNTALSY